MKIKQHFLIKTTHPNSSFYVLKYSEKNNLLQNIKLKMLSFKKNEKNLKIITIKNIKNMHLKKKLFYFDLIIQKNVIRF